MTAIDFTGWISTSEAARRLRVTPDRVAQLRRERRLDVLETPVGNLIGAESVERFDRERKARTIRREERARELVTA